ncbi:hypothetical protein DMT42_22350 [Streptomyces actuosus]|uniref:Uncharacterized protein n=1 Tax=Streptomyces actuosus TaxID=1885 RepID=A0A2U9P4T8_STRAS|nr:hypothetical protein DMT42_22350 [Streptomyces actuosus]
MGVPPARAKPRAWGRVGAAAPRQRRAARPTPGRHQRRAPHRPTPTDRQPTRPAPHQAGRRARPTVRAQ